MDGMGITTLPMWVNVFLGIVAALGGWEAIKYVLSLRANRRKDKAAADEADAVAHQQDAEWRQKELELVTSFVDTAKRQYEDVVQRYDEMKAEKKEDRRIIAELRKEISELKIVQAEHERKVIGLQRAFSESETRRRAAERLYCDVEECPKRNPPLGTFGSGEIPQPRLANGRFAARKKS